VRGSGDDETKVQCGGFVLHDGGVGFCSAIMGGGGGGGWLTSC
jgi:hypothetical protein